MASIALTGKAMAKVRSHIVVEVVQTIAVNLAERSRGEGLETEWFVRKQKAEERPLVLSKAPEGADENRKHGRMQGVEAKGSIGKALRLGRAVPTQANRAVDRLLNVLMIRAGNLAGGDVQR